MNLNLLIIGLEDLEEVSKAIKQKNNKYQKLRLKKKKKLLFQRDIIEDTEIVK